MSGQRQPVDDARLQAWVDARLPADEAALLTARLAEVPAELERAQALRAQAELLQQHFAVANDAPIPERLLAAARGESPAHGDAAGSAAGLGGPRADRPAARPARDRWPARGWLAQAAVVLVALGVGAAGGWYARDGSFRPRTPSGTLIQAATLAHATYVPEVRHPVEVGAEQQAHLVTWLSKRVGTALRAPDLQEQRYELVGGRLLPSDNGPAAQFMYENLQGQRLTLYVRRSATGNDTAFRFAQQGNVLSFYWVDRGFGYALSGEIDRPALHGIADEVYRQLNP